MNAPPQPDESTDYENIPAELRSHESWVCWRYHARADGKPAKVPVIPQPDVAGTPANISDPETWRTFADAVTCLATDERGAGELGGIGFVFSENDPYMGIDLDGCVDENGEMAEWAAEIISRVDSYTEYSPSGTGVHIIVAGEVPSGGVRRGQTEMYDTARYFTMTGLRVDGTPREIHDRQDAIDALYAELTPEVRPEPRSELRSSQVGGRTTRTQGDDYLLSKAKGAKNGAKFERLWNGSTAGYPSQSEADQALCCQLAFWTGGNRRQMDRLFRRSGLMRSKWDARHGSDGRTYGEMTIDAALRRVDNYYKY
jgi:putative DNA primase/helicase